MDWPHQCAAVIPCRNEAATIGGVVAGVRRHSPTVIVVDDGSTDATVDAATRAGAEIVRLSRRGGKGAALRAGWRHVQVRSFAWALNLDGDGQHLADDIPKFFQCAEETHAAMVIGNRMGQADAMPWLRRTVNRWMSRRLSDRAGKALPDSQCGFRLVNLLSPALARLQTEHFEIESEMLLSFIRAGEQVEFVPIQVVGAGPQSHIRPLPDTWRWLRWWRRDRRQ